MRFRESRLVLFRKLRNGRIK